MHQDAQTLSFSSVQALLLLCTKLALRACSIVTQSYQNSAVKQYSKGANDPVTEADFKIQTLIVRALRKEFPALRVIGEEETEYQGHIDGSLEQYAGLQLPEGLQIVNEYQVKGLCVWIDPIDNTRGFIEGQAEAVTVLIGISYNKKATFGVIGLPYQKIDGIATAKPQVYVGSAPSSQSFIYSPVDKSWASLTRPDPCPAPVVCMSPTRKNIIESLICTELKGSRIMAGGAGYKCLLVVLGRADLQAYCQSYTKKWDTCAGEAIIRALGGYFCDQIGSQILYEPEAKSYVNKQGLLCGFVEQYRQVAVQTYIKYKQDNKPTL